MKSYKLIFAMFLAVFCLNLQAKSGKDISFFGDYIFDGSFYKELGVDLNDVISLEAHPAIARYRLGRHYSRSHDVELLSDQGNDPVTDYETELPRASQPEISPFEKVILTAYLENPDDAWLAKFLAVYHLNKSLLKKRNKDGRALGHTIIAQYFLNRAIELGDERRWVQKALEKAEWKLNSVMNNHVGLDFSEDREAHKYFINAFNYNEQNRYRAVSKLLDDFVQHPGSLLTNAYLTASNIWVGGEADYNDPTVLYSFVLSSFFSVRIVALAQSAELAWMEDPDTNQRFRLASILGGWTVPARRWLAKLHENHDAIALLDAEHREWLAINRAFHSASIGLMMFGEEENFWEGFFAWQAGFQHCEEIPEFRSCIDRPRFSYNLLSFILGGVDYFIKGGQLETAQMVLFTRYNPFFQYEGWDLGRDAWEHRENNMMAIYEAYQNDNPDDDPTHFLLKSRKWGPDTITCQTCHQAQSREWSEEEINTVQLPHESVRTIGDWPDETTTWYGAVK